MRFVSKIKSIRHDRGGCRVTLFGTNAFPEISFYVYAGSKEHERLLGNLINGDTVSIELTTQIQDCKDIPVVIRPHRSKVLAMVKDVVVACVVDDSIKNILLQEIEKIEEEL